MGDEGRSDWKIDELNVLNKQLPYTTKALLMRILYGYRKKLSENETDDE